jgi:hypothetical protein
MVAGGLLPEDLVMSRGSCGSIPIPAELRNVAGAMSQCVTNAW